MWSVYLEVTKYKKCLSFWSQDPYNLYVVAVVGSIQKFCLKIAILENCQNWKLLGLKIVKFTSCQNDWPPKLQVVKIASCQNWKLFHYFLLNVSIFDELSWKLPKLQVAKVESDFIISC